MWSRRAQEYEQKINSGKLYELAEVVKDLNKKTDIIAEQSYSERLLFEKAYNRLKSEFEVVMGEKAQQKMDKALKYKENHPRIGAHPRFNVGKWRRDRDSNPGWGRPHNGFRDRPVRPLRHLSAKTCSSVTDGLERPWRRERDSNPR